jgi:hypothetical protein
MLRAAMLALLNEARKADSVFFLTGAACSAREVVDCELTAALESEKIFFRKKFRELPARRQAPDRFHRSFKRQR